MSVTPPITAGRSIASYQADSINDTDWHTLNSSDFYDPITGNQFAADRPFSFVGVENGSTTSTKAFLKLRARTAANDGKTNTDGVIAIPGKYSTDVAAVDGGQNVTSIAYAKAAGGDSLTIYAGFN